ncbi:anhydro-N-acetylmuramic acid kinase [Cyclobacterium plantarum]|uniref:Anhydro-N-acetylmuramic acid kinase n=1 Tax=Cyclobacterium plantarum TaxID=2716263 RepID=A0ABX0H4Q1_9BACT|nr:anhydro-N-acetylmuramic acid kinase [Cyclobacterium plantarum]NHE55261.1 anhydro-N-acetylmuramic acid kinase [Cyclobacterium plantarum]
MDEPKWYEVVGLMSGTSGDGLDLAFCKFWKNDAWSFEIQKATTIPFPEKLEQSLKSAHLLDAASLEILDIEFGTWMGNKVKVVCDSSGLQPSAIASHGHTVFHQPSKGMTKQIGDGFALWQSSGIPVINDFRKLDVILGGQGAPLVPVGDELLFPNYDYALNLGGIANISMEVDKQRKAFDTCPFNLLFNYFAQKAGKAFDANGDLARTGKVSAELLAALEKLPYYRLSGARSLGREDIEKDFIPTLESVDTSVPDTLATLSEHFARCISEILLQQKNTGDQKKLLVTGGGAYNTFFIENLSAKIQPRIEVSLPENQIIDFKEALVFAFLGVLRWRGENNCLASVTAASRDSSGGTMYGFFS